MKNKTPHIYRGCMHIHTKFSDGSGTVPEVIEAAQGAELDWIIITDHDSLGGKQFEGRYDRVMVLVGHEVTPVHSHYLALGVEKVISNKLPTQAYVDESYAQGGFGIMAHPDDHLDDLKKAIHPWRDWSIDGPSQREGHTVGLEIWNFMSDWRAKSGQYSRKEMINEPAKLLSGPTPIVLAWWDRLNLEGKRTFVIGGLDAHATREFGLTGMTTLFPYQWMFGSLTNYLLLEEPLSPNEEKATQQIYTALREGRSYFVNRLDGTAPDLPLVAQRGDEVWHIGDTISLKDGPLTLRMDAGSDTEVRLVHNGELLLATIHELDKLIDQPGVYRMEGHRNGRPWLYTNPIYITE